MRRKLSILFAAAAVLAAVAVPIAAQGARAHHTANAVTVTLKEFKITMPKTLKAGPTTFKVSNKGKFPHDIVLAFHSAGTPKFGTAQIKPGASATVTATLTPGAYVLICGVGAGFHASSGMIHAFTVGKFDFTTGKWG